MEAWRTQRRGRVVSVACLIVVLVQGARNWALAGPIAEEKELQRLLVEKHETALKEWKLLTAVGRKTPPPPTDATANAAKRVLASTLELDWTSKKRIQFWQDFLRELKSQERIFEALEKAGVRDAMLGLLPLQYVRLEVEIHLLKEKRTAKASEKR